MPKQKIIIAHFNLEVGGVERSLIGMLDGIDYTRYAVDLLLFKHGGELQPLLNPQVNLLPEMAAYAAIEKPIKQVLFSRQFPVAIARLAAKSVNLLKKKLGRTAGYLLPRSLRYAVPFLPYIQGEYDLAISFLSPHDAVLDRVKAKKKIGWIHTDYAAMETGVDIALELPMWSRLDAIAAVSEELRKAFIALYPSLADKVMVIENILSAEFVRQQADALDVSAEMPAEPGVIRLCSVGRFSHQKNFDSVPEVVRRLNETGNSKLETREAGEKDTHCQSQTSSPKFQVSSFKFQIKWYLIGYGGDEALIRAKIAEAGVGDQVIILGKKTNPYPYMKACDLYVQPSRYEGKAVTVREAQMLGKPVLITDFPTAKSQLENNVDGLICPLDNAAIADAIRRLIEDRELRNRLAQTAATRDYSNAGEVEKIYELMGGGGGVSGE